MTPELWVILAALLAAVSCALIGSFLIVRGEAMLGDAISHAVLPGLVIAFLLTSSRAVLPMVLGAGAAGLVTAFLTSSLGRTGRLYREAALGIVFTSLFAVGVVLVAIYTDQVDLDQECVLYGEIAYTPWDTFVVDGVSYGPRAIWVLGGALIANLLFISLFFKQLKITSFDAQLAQSVGISPIRWHYLLMAMVSLTVVSAFESVGAILVVAMLILPPATASLITGRLRTLLLLAAVFGSVAALGGFYLASAINASIAGAMAVVAGLVFAVVLFAMKVFASKIELPTHDESRIPSS